MRSFAALILASLLCACGTSGSGRDASAVPPRSAWIVGPDGRALGQANFTEAPSGVMIRLEFSAGALPPGWHGLHVHGAGICSDFAAGFQASGAHFGHNNRVQHGLMNPAGPESGDLPNLFAPPAGPFGAEFFSPRLTLAAEAVRGRMPLLDADGAALIIHANADDQITQPIGGAGARIACAALTTLP
jgi:superoxide dismutase, Cu-Zn family